MGEKDVDPLFKLPRIPAEAIRDLQDELSEFELPARQLDAEVMDEFHSQASEIRHRGKDHRSSISSNPPVIPQKNIVKERLHAFLLLTSLRTLYSTFSGMLY